MNRVWVSKGSGLLEATGLVAGGQGGDRAVGALLATNLTAQVIAIEATGSLHRAWAAELERRHPGALRLFAPSETKAAQTQWARPVQDR